MLDTKSGSSRPANPKQDSRFPESEKLFSQELVMAAANHYWLLLIGPIVVGLIAYAIASVVPGKYTSTSFLRIDRGQARSLEALMTSPGEAEKILSKYPATGSSIEARVRYLSSNLGLTDVEPGGDRQTVRLFRLDISYWDPQTAQAINSQLIDEWLGTTLPPPTERATLEAELERNKVAAAANTALIQQLQKEATTLVAPNSMSGEIASPISDLITKRDMNQAMIVTLQNKLAGVPRDVIAVPPHLPEEPSVPKKGAVAILSGVAAIPALLILVLLGRRFAPGRSALDVLSKPFARRAT
jgi:uncharacterized protein involved in exopolysaccharide biosynthesis